MLSGILKILRELAFLLSVPNGKSQKMKIVLLAGLILTSFLAARVRAMEITDVYWAEDIEGGVIEVLVDAWPSAWDGWRCYLNGEEVPMEGVEEDDFTILPNDELEAPPTGLFVGSKPWLSTVRGTYFPCVGSLQFDIPGVGLTNIYEFNLLGEGCETKARWARNPRPKDGAENVAADTVVSWLPGECAVSHDVFFGTNWDDVNDANNASSEYKGNQPLDANSYDPCGLEAETTYYWRIDEVNDPCVWKGDVWSFTTIPFTAHNPRPEDGAGGVLIEPVLSWDAGFGAVSHDVYFGKSTPLPFKGNQTVAVYEPGVLPANTSYWWRIDEVGPGGTIPGELWSFTTGSHGVGELRIISWNIEFLGIRSPRRTPEQLDAIAERILGFDSAVLALQERADVSTSEYIRSQLGPSWKIYPYLDNWNALLYDEDKVEMLSVELLYTLDNPPYTPYPSGRPRPVSGVFQPVRMDAEPFRVIGVHCYGEQIPAEGEWLRAKIIEFLENPHEPNDIILLGDLNGEPPGEAPHPQLQQGGYIYLLPKENGDDTAVSGSRIDHFYVTETAMDKVPKESSFVIRPEHYGETPEEFKETYSDHYPISMEFVCVGTAASRPTPADRASGVSTDAVLAWAKGIRADSHDVYFGTDFDDVNDAGTSSSEYKSRQSVDANTYDPCGLELNIPYYWRIDEVNDPNMWRGNIWSFTTANYVVVDNMESYNDTDNKIWDTWIDGWGNDTGSVIGLGTDPCQPVHGGKQSMVYDYDNDYMWALYKYSEVYRTFSDPCDWTVLGVKVLTLYFYGDPGNDATETEQMYVGLEDSTGAGSYAEVRYGDNGEDMNDIKEEKWHEWNTALTDFTGVDANDVNKVYIGFGDRDAPVAGGSGTVYFDDFRLYARRCILPGPYADISGDCVVDGKDLKIMAEEWLDSGSVVADLYGDDRVNFKDFAILVEGWLEEKLWPPEE